MKEVTLERKLSLCDSAYKIDHRKAMREFQKAANIIRQSKRESINISNKVHAKSEYIFKELPRLFMAVNRLREETRAGNNPKQQIHRAYGIMDDLLVCLWELNDLIDKKDK